VEEEIIELPKNTVIEKNGDHMELKLNGQVFLRISLRDAKVEVPLDSNYITLGLLIKEKLTNGINVPLPFFFQKPPT